MSRSLLPAWHIGPRGIMNTQFKKTMEEIGAKTQVCLRVVFADGSSWQNHQRTPDVTIFIRNGRAAWRVLLFGHVGFLEAYFNGDIDIEGSLAHAFRAGMDAGFDGEPTFLVKVRNWWHELRYSNASISQAKANARFHYGPGQDFYREWLDEAGMAYTCSWFADGSNTLEEAQVAKMDHVCRKVLLKRGDTFADIGSSWGNLLFYAWEKYGALGTGINTTTEQVQETRAEIKRRGLEGKIEVLERDFRELPRHFTEVALEHLDLALEAAALDLGARFLDLFGGGVDAGAERAVLLPGVEEQVAPAAADVGEGVASLEQDLAAHVIHLGDLRFLERLGSVGEPGAGVGHARFVEPFPVEVLSRPVVKARVRLRLRNRRVAVSEFVPPVAHLDEESRLAVETGVHAGAESVREAALDIDIAVEIGLEKSDVAEQQHPPCGAAVADEDGDVRRALAVLPGGAVGEDDAETDLGLRADLLHRLLELRVHDPLGPMCHGGRSDLDIFSRSFEAADRFC